MKDGGLFQILGLTDKLPLYTLQEIQVTLAVHGHLILLGNET
jgi:hypothetical protein